MVMSTKMRNPSLPKPVSACLASLMCLCATACAGEPHTWRSGPILPQSPPRTEHPPIDDKPVEPVEPVDRMPVTARVVEVNGRPLLDLRVGDKPLIVPGQQPLYTETACTVKVRTEVISEGILLHFSLSNDTAEPAATPDFHIAGINMPQREIEILENWNNVNFKQPLDRNVQQLHPVRSYPARIYSPVMGIRTGEVFLGSSFIYPAFDVKKEVNLDYRYNARERTWSMRYRIWDENNLAEAREGNYDPAVFKPGERMSFTIAVTVAKPSQWVTAFRPYRDFFRETYGSVRYTASREPIMGLTLGIPSRISPLNPKGYGANGPAGEGRLDIVGWRGFYRRIMDDSQRLGYRRFLLWMPAGSYNVHRDTNMVWEITSSWSPAMYETAHELRRLHQAGVTVGLWWGRAFSISGGFDSGRRHPWDPDNEADNAAAFRELDRAYDMGVRLIGLDDTRRSIFPSDWHPSSDVLFRRIFPILYQRYPEMRWVIEPGASDFLHLWGSTFMWAGQVHGPTEFADYLVPGHESHAVLRPTSPLRGQDEPYAHMSPQLLRQYIRWGYTPIVFSPERYNLRVDRALLDSLEE